MIRVPALLASLVLTACATPQPLTDSELQEMASPRCQGAQHCAAMWQRAQVWLANHSALKIQIANDAVIQTYSPTKNDATLGFTITRELLSADTYIITARAGCGNMFGCFPPPQRALLALHRHLRDTPK